MSIRLLSILIFTLATSMITAAPHISSIVWGIITVIDPDGKKQTYKDCMLFPGGSKEWDWSLTGTQHKPGIQIADLKEFINDVDIIILSRGMENRLLLKDDTKEYLEKSGKEHFYVPTLEAARLYNKYVEEGKKVGALIHSTC